MKTSNAVITVPMMGPGKSSGSADKATFSIGVPLSGGSAVPLVADSRRVTPKQFAKLVNQKNRWENPQTRGPKKSNDDAPAQRALELKKASYTWDEIAVRLGPEFGYKSSDGWRKAVERYRLQNKPSKRT